MITAIDKTTALVLIDLQNSMVELPLAHPVADVLKNANKLISAFRSAELPVVLVNVNLSGARWTKTRKDLKQTSRAFKDNSQDITHEIKIEPNDILITKHNWGAFFETSLHEDLQNRGITSIVIGGIATSIGVEATARQASERSYNIAFALDAMTDMVSSAHDNSIKVIFPRIGEVGTTNEIIAKMNKQEGQD